MPSSLRVTSTASHPTLAASCSAASAISRIACHRAPRGVGQLLAVRRDQRRAAIDAEIEALGIDDHRLAELARLVDDGADDRRAQHALGIVGQHHCIRTRHRRSAGLDQRLLDVLPHRRGELPVGPQQMGGIVLGDEPHLAGGRARRIDQQMRLDRSDSDSANARASVRPASSSPMTLTKMQRAPSAAMPRATLPAPPSSCSSRPTAITSVGASGETLRHLAVDEVVEHEVADAEHRRVGRTSPTAGRSDASDLPYAVSAAQRYWSGWSRYRPTYCATASSSGVKPPL